MTVVMCICITILYICYKYLVLYNTNCTSMQKLVFYIIGTYHVHCTHIISVLARDLNFVYSI